MLAGCESIQRGNERGLLRRQMVLCQRGKQRDVFGDGKAGERVEEIIGRLQ